MWRICFFESIIMNEIKKKNNVGNDDKYFK